MVKFVTNQTQIPDDKIELITFEQFNAECDSLTGFIGIDTETEGFNPYKSKVLSLQIGNYDVQYVIEWQFAPEETVNFLRSFFKDNNRVFGFHNAKFDLRFLMLEGIWPNHVYDSFLAESVLYQGLNYELYPKGLADLAMKYCNVKLDKSIRGNIHWQGLTPSVINYAADDVKYLEQIRNAQMALINDKLLYRTLSLENEFVKVLAYIEMCGLRIDVPSWKDRVKKDEQILAEKLEALNEFIISSGRFEEYVNRQMDLFSEGFSCNINWSSPTQCVKFFQKLGLNLLTKDKKTGKMKYSVDAKILTPQKNIDPVVDVYLDFKGQEKVISTYGMNWIKQIDPVTGRLHTQFKQLIDTARLSSGGKNQKTKENYINFLNIPQDNAIRNCIIPKEGYVFIDSDYSSQEQVVLANESKEPKLLEFYEKNLEGGDMHTFICKKLWPELEPLSVDEVKSKHKDKRHMAKIAGLKENYK